MTGKASFSLKDQSVVSVFYLVSNYTATRNQREVLVFVEIPELFLQYKIFFLIIKVKIQNFKNE